MPSSFAALSLSPLSCRSVSRIACRSISANGVTASGLSRWVTGATGDYTAPMSVHMEIPKLRRQITYMQDVDRRERGGPLDRVFELANIARPRVVHHCA